MAPSLAALLAPLLANSWPAHNAPMSPAQFEQWMAIRKAQLVADPYGFAFGPRRPAEGYRPTPFGTPSPPPVAFGGWPPMHGWGVSGWNWGRGPTPNGPIYPHGLVNPAPRWVPPIRT